MTLPSTQKVCIPEVTEEPRLFGLSQKLLVSFAFNGRALSCFGLDRPPPSHPKGPSNILRDTKAQQANVVIPGGPSIYHAPAWSL